MGNFLSVLVSEQIEKIETVFVQIGGGNFYRYDLSRPGYEREREEISKPEPAKTYDTTSPVVRGTVDEFLIEYDDRVRELKTYGDFRDSSLSDEDLQIAPATP